MDIYRSQASLDIDFIESAFHDCYSDVQQHTNCN